jgi:hypothetical protein
MQSLYEPCFLLSTIDSSVLSLFYLSIAKTQTLVSLKYIVLFHIHSVLMGTLT